MRIYFYTLLFLIQHCVAVDGQSNVGSEIDADLSLPSNLKVYPLGNFDTRDKSFIGSSLLFEDWQVAKIMPVKSDEFLDEPYKLNYDLRAKAFLIYTKGNAFSLPTIHVGQIKVYGRVNGGENYVVYRDMNNQHLLFKEIVNGEIQLLSNTSIKIIKSHYNAALDVGSIRPKIVKKEQLYIARNGHVYQLPKKRKDLGKRLDPHADIADFLKDQKIDLKDEAELKSAILKLNNKIEHYEINNK